MLCILQDNGLFFKLKKTNKFDDTTYIIWYISQEDELWNSVHRSLLSSVLWQILIWPNEYTCGNKIMQFNVSSTLCPFLVETVSGICSQQSCDFTVSMLATSDPEAPTAALNKPLCLHDGTRTRAARTGPNWPQGPKWPLTPPESSPQTDWLHWHLVCPHQNKTDSFSIYLMLCFF